MEALITIGAIWLFCALMHFLFTSETLKLATEPILEVFEKLFFFWRKDDKSN